MKRETTMDGRKRFGSSQRTPLCINRITDFWAQLAITCNYSTQLVLGDGSVWRYAHGEWVAFAGAWA
jgi:hypothetical protein